MIRIKEIVYKGLEGCIELSNEYAELAIPTKIGIRILSYKLRNRQNIFKNFDNQIGNVISENWQIFGGHRLWVAPEDMQKSYEPDGIPLKEFSIQKNGVTLLQRTGKLSKISKHLVITLCQNSAEVTLTHTITNQSAKLQKVAAWALTALDKGSVCTANYSSGALSPAADRKLVLWPFTDIYDSRLQLSDKIIVKQSQAKDKPFKIGSFITSGSAHCVIGDTVFTKLFCADAAAEYPDLGCNFECYTNGEFLELESLSPVKVLSRGQSIEHTEIWQLTPYKL